MAKAVSLQKTKKEEKIARLLKRLEEFEENIKKGEVYTREELGW